MEKTLLQPFWVQDIVFGLWTDIKWIRRVWRSPKDLKQSSHGYFISEAALWILLMWSMYDARAENEIPHTQLKRGLSECTALWAFRANLNMKAFPQILQKFFRSLMCLARMCLLLASLVESFIPHSSHKKSLALLAGRDS